jgi:N-acetyl-beta-hexosaminidase
MYGMETFSQLVMQGGIINATSITITDFPAYHVRSFMADTGRRYGARFSTESSTRGCYWFPRLLA